MKKLVLALTLVLLGLTLTACNNETEDEVVSLTVWASELDQELMQDMIDSFKEEYAAEATFEITLGAVSESNAKDEVLNDVEAAADVFVFADDQLNELVTAGALQQVLENTDAVIAANGGETSGSVQAAMRNGNLYAYPMTADNGYFLFYDKSVYSETDVETLDGILAAAEADGSQFTMQINNGWYLYSFFAGAGLNLSYNGIVNDVDWNSATGVNVAKAIITMANHPGYVNLTDAEFVTGLQDGSITAGVNGIWNAEVAEEEWGDNYAAAKLPTFTVNGVQTQMSSFAGYKLVGVNATSQHPYWAMKLAEWFTNEENQILRFETRGLGPSNVNAAASDSVQATPAIAALAEQSAFATVQNVGGNYWAPTETFGQLIITGELTLQGDIQTALDTMVAGIETSTVE
jgi:arabinogalactan oligomer/maltooligosaccharide transport system substrate-binding protein